MPLTRRRILGLVPAVAGVSLLSACGGDAGHSGSFMVDDETLLPPLGAGDAASVFPSSVASGDPTPSGVILWTRLEQSAIEPDQDVLWEVAEDERFLRRVAEHYGASPTLVYLESPVVVDNVSGEVISD